jgi:hypothetical protein
MQQNFVVSARGQIHLHALTDGTDNGWLTAQHRMLAH